jgi:hypothetical protein
VVGIHSYGGMIIPAMSTWWLIVMHRGHGECMVGVVRVMMWVWMGIVSLVDMRRGWWMGTV